MSMNLTGFRPNLAAESSDWDFNKLQFPVYVSPKIDGIRCMTHPVLGPSSRSLKPIPNRYISDFLAQPALKWLDGEIVVGPSHAPDVFNRSQSGVMSRDGQPSFTYLVFDNFEAGNMCGFGIRYEDARRVVDKAIADLGDTGCIRLLPHTMVYNLEELWDFEAGTVEDGFEGIMIRSPGGKYKCGRSTLREQGLIKVKRFVDDEAQIIGWKPLMRNQNDPVIDALGLQKRGYSKDGKVADLTMAGKFNMLGLTGKWRGIEFDCGSGLDEAQRRDIAANFDTKYKGQMGSYKYQPHGSLDAPRSPIWKGLRHD